MSTHALQFLILTVSGWVTRKQQHAIKYLKRENRILQEKLGGKRIRFTDKERDEFDPNGKVKTRERLGGLLNFYYREAAG